MGVYVVLAADVFLDQVVLALVAEDYVNLQTNELLYINGWYFNNS